jgi:hypothetical protein
MDRTLASDRQAVDEFIAACVNAFDEQTFDDLWQDLERRGIDAESIQFNVLNFVEEIKKEYAGPR